MQEILEDKSHLWSFAAIPMIIDQDVGFHMHEEKTNYIWYELFVPELSRPGT